MKNLSKKFIAFLWVLGALALGVFTSAMTYSWGLVTFDASDQAVVDTWISNALANLWAWFLFVLPYLGVALGILLVIGIVMFIAKRARS